MGKDTITDQYFSIVCVHGLGGSVTSTWHHDETGKTWINDADFLGRLKDVARVMTYGYNGDVAANMTSASIALHATELLGMLLTAFGRWGGGPLIFVAHGMGGLIVKRAVLLAQNVAAYRAIQENCSGVIFLGTPHHKTDSEALLVAVRNTAALLGRKGSKITDDDMREYAEAVREVNVDFTGPRIAHLDLVSFAEEKPTSLTLPNDNPHTTQIVSAHCAQMKESPVSKSLSMDCIHKDLPKFASSTDPRFRIFLEELAFCVEEAMSDAIEPPPPALSQTIGMMAPLPPPPLPGPGPKPPIEPKKQPEKKQSEEKKETKDRKHDPAAYQDGTEMQFKIWSQQKNSEDTKSRRDSFIASLKGWSEDNFGNDISPLPGSCDWIQNDFRFKGWLATNHSHTLLVSGNPGSGKTYLAKAMAERLKSIRGPHDIVLSFFCNTELTEEKRPRILDFFLSEMLKVRPKWFDYIPLKYNDRNKDSPPPSLGSLIDIFNTLKRTINHTTVWMVIDGLHQCDIDYASVLLERLQSIMDTLPPANVSKPPDRVEIGRPPFVKFKPFITISPNEVMISGSTLASHIDMPPAEVKKEIAQFVDASTALLPDAPSRLSQEIGDKIKKNARLFFYHAKYSLQLIESATNVARDGTYDFRSRCPEELAHYYDRDILPLLQNTEHPPLPRTALIMIISAAHTLACDEIADAIASLYHDDELRRLNVSWLLGKHCPRLLRWQHGGAVTMVHDSLLRHFEGFLSKEERHANMAAICLAYLSRKDFEKPLLAPYENVQDSSAFTLNQPQFRFLRYAAMNWRDHLNSSGTLAGPLIKQFDAFFNDSSPYYKSWYSAHCWLNYQSEEAASYGNPLLLSLIPECNMNIIRHILPPGLQPKQPGTISLRDRMWTKFRSYLRRQVADEQSLSFLKAMTNFEGLNAIMVSAVHRNKEMVMATLQWPLNINERSARSGATAIMLAVQARQRLVGGEAVDPEDIILALLEAGADPNISDNKGSTPLGYACLQGSLSTASLLLNFGAQADVANLYGFSILEAAYHSDKVEMVRMLVLGYGVDVDTRDSRGRTMINASIYDDKFDMFLVFVQVADINQIDESGLAPIHIITQPKKIDWMPHLLRRSDLNLNLHSEGWGDNGQPTKWNALKYAINDENFNALKLLLEAGALPGISTHMMTDELFKAANTDNYDMVELLLSYKAPVNAIHRSPRYPDKTALACACYRNNERIVSLLLDNGADPTVEEGYGLPGPLHSAVRTGNVNIVKLLLENQLKPDVNYQPETDDHILLIASRRDSDDILGLLLEQQPDMSVFSTGNPTTSPIHEAACFGFLKNVDVLLKYEPKLLNLQLEKGLLFETPLHAACRHNQKDVVLRLLESSARTDLMSCHYKASVLISACGSGNLDIIKAILAANRALLDMQSYDGMTPLMTACGVGDVKAVEFLLKSGADIAIKDCVGRSCVASMLSCEEPRARLRIAQLLLDHGLGINDIVNVRGLSFLGEACIYGDLQVIKLLLKNGADPSRAQQGPGGADAWNTALHIALQCEHEEAVALLLKPEWGAPTWITNLNCDGGNILHLNQPTRKGQAILGKIYWACKGIEAKTGADCFKDMLAVRDRTDRRPLDWSVTALPTKLTDLGRAKIRKTITTQITQLLSVSRRTYSEHAHLMEYMVYNLLELGGFNSEAILLLQHITSSPDMLTRDDELRLVGSYIYTCVKCEETVHETVYICRFCAAGLCEECKDTWDIDRGVYVHEYLEVPILPETDFNSAEVQAALERLKEAFAGPFEAEDRSQAIPDRTDVFRRNGHEDDLEVHRPRSQSPPTSTFSFDPQSPKTSLSLAALHAFGYLEFPRRAWSQRLPLAARVEARIAPFEQLIKPQRLAHEDLLWRTEHWWRRNVQELEYFVSSGRRTDYQDLEIVRREITLLDVRRLFADEGRDRVRGRRRRRRWVETQRSGSSSRSPIRYESRGRSRSRSWSQSRSRSRSGSRSRSRSVGREPVYVVERRARDWDDISSVSSAGSGSGPNRERVRERVKDIDFIVVDDYDSTSVYSTSSRGRF
jgi:ankyrin repeat protein